VRVSGRIRPLPLSALEAVPTLTPARVATSVRRARADGTVSMTLEAAVCVESDTGDPYLLCGLRSLRPPPHRGRRKTTAQLWEKLLALLNGIDGIRS
jgi:hypothetical protein